MCRPCDSKVAVVDYRSHRAERSGRSPLVLALAAAGGLLGVGAALDVSGLTRPQGPLVAADPAPSPAADGLAVAADRIGRSGQAPAADAAATTAATAGRGAGAASGGPNAAAGASASAGKSAAAPPGGGPPGANQNPPTAAGPAAPSQSAAAVRPGTPAAAGYAAQVMSLVNQAREAHGCTALRSDSAIAQAATGHSRDMAVAGYFGHNTPAGVTPWTRMQRDGYNAPGGENIARGFATPADVMAAWMASPEHRANILNCSFRSAGVGYYAAPPTGAPTQVGGPWWTQDFGYS